MRPGETPHTSTPIAGAQTSQADTLSQGHQRLPPAASPGGWPRQGLPSSPPHAWHRETACLVQCLPALWLGSWHPRITGRLQRSCGAEALAISAGLLQADIARQWHCRSIYFVLQDCL